MPLVGARRRGELAPRVARRPGLRWQPSRSCSSLRPSGDPSGRCARRAAIGVHVPRRRALVDRRAPRLLGLGGRARLHGRAPRRVVRPVDRGDRASRSDSARSSTSPGTFSSGAGSTSTAGACSSVLALSAAVTVARARRGSAVGVVQRRCCSRCSASSPAAGRSRGARAASGSRRSSGSASRACGRRRSSPATSSARRSVAPRSRTAATRCSGSRSRRCSSARRSRTSGRAGGGS